MYLSYYKHPILQIFDEEVSKSYPKFLPKLWANFNPANPGFRIYKGDELQQMDDEQKWLSISTLSAQINTDIGMGKYADGRFNIYLVSPTFFNAMQKSYDKLRPVMDEDGALRSVYEDAVFIIGERTLVFMHLTDDNFRFMEFRNDRLCHISDFSINDAEDVPLSKYQDMDTMTVADFGGYEDIWTPDLILYQQSFILFFKKYGNIDIEMLPARQKVKRSTLIGEKVNNFMGVDVQVLDSRWFTTICRDEGFLVSGHFRLQNVKENGEWTKRLIYINPYAKHGYHRLATIVNLEGKEGVE